MNLSKAAGRSLFLVVFASLLTPISYTDIVINEVQAANQGGYLDEFGDTPDWIELYNRGLQAVNLAGYGLSDDDDRPFRWTFPNVTLEPDSYLVIFASGRDLRPDENAFINGILREVYEGIPGGQVAQLLAAPSFPDFPDQRHIISSAFEAPTNIGDHYGQRMQAYLVPPLTGYYTFWISGDDESHLYLSTDNTPDNIQLIAQIPGWTLPREWEKYPQQQSALIYLEAGQHYYIKALMKEHEGGDNLAVRWRLPDNKIEEPISIDHLYWHTTGLHTNFSIDAAGEELILTHPNGTRIDAIPPTEIPGNISYGRQPDGADDWYFFNEPTPGTTNNDSAIFSGVTALPEFSTESGFYTSSVTLSLTHQDEDTQIIYTLDSSIPDPENLSGTSYGYKNQYPNGELRYRTYITYPYETPLTINRQFSGFSGITKINTENSNPSEGLPRWSVENNELIQHSLEANVRLMFGNRNWHDYEFSCQAMKTSGAEGFLFFFRTRNNQLYWFNIGGWQNTRHTIQKDNGAILDGLQIDGNNLINENQWYDLRVRCEGNRFQCWIDDELLFDFTDLAGHMTGQVGLGTWQTTTRYRNIEVRELDGGTLFSGIPNMEPFDGAATIVRARAFKEGYLPSSTATHTYFIDTEIQERFNLPVVSLAVEEPDFWGYETGIYVAGEGQEQYNNPQFFNRGTTWERPVHLTFFEPQGKTGFSLDIGARIHGGATRMFPQKSLRLYARGSYGENTIQYPVFPGYPYGSFRRLLLRNSGNDFEHTMYRDAMLQRVLSGMFFETSAYQPAVVFINGEYWGIQNFRERYDKHFIERKYNIKPEDLDLLTFQLMSTPLPKEGDDEHYIDTIHYIENNDVSESEHYEYIQTRIDIENFIDYNIAQIFIANTDWPGNNNDFWRKRTDQFEPDAPYGHDGRWRWLLYDTDFGAGLTGSYTHNTLVFATATNGPVWPNPPWATLIFRELLNNLQFQHAFISRFSDLLNSQFLPDRIVSIIDEMRRTIDMEMQHHIARWNRPATYATWRSNVKVMQNFALNRPTYIRAHLRNYFNLSDERQIVLNLPNPTEGYIRINSIDIQGDASAAFQWNGLYFSGMPMEIEAIAYSGYHFSHWEGLPVGTPAKTTLNLQDNIEITAHFEPVYLLHYWHFNLLTDITHTLLYSDYSYSDTASLVYSGSGMGYMDRVDQGTTLNARLGATAGNALRVRNPSNTRDLVLQLPTSGYKDIVLRYAVMRTTNGAQNHQVYYRIKRDGGWIPIGNTYDIKDDFVLMEINFSDIAGVNNNPDFAVRIQFIGTEASEDSGNNRFDNISLEGIPLSGIIPPPSIKVPIGLQSGIEMGNPIPINLDNIFHNPTDTPLTYQAICLKEDITEVMILGNMLELSPTQRGDTKIIVSASDGVNQPMELDFRLMVYPKPVVLHEQGFNFTYWNPEEPEGNYPENMLFLQSAVTDPGVAAPLLHPYSIPLAEYHEEDTHGFPYNNSNRTRITGRETGGISFINTGRGRDVGGALVAIDTTGIEQLILHWTPGTILRNDRLYGIRLQYRKAIDEPFDDVLINGLPVEYLAQADGHLAHYGPTLLPDHLLGVDYLQLLWRYYHIAGDAGPRSELQLEHIMISDHENMYHSADRFRTGYIDLPDLMRVIQFYNYDGYHCATKDEMLEDGYLPGNNLAQRDCMPHDVDFEPQNWVIDLHELLRIIQLYNSTGYYPCINAPDQYCSSLQ